MPNWCENNLIIEGEEKELKKFKEKVKKGFTLSKFIRMPKELKELEKLESIQFPSDSIKARINEIKYKHKIKGSFPGWYTWNLNNFGCKWDISNVEMLFDKKNEVIYNFESPWSPPINGIINIAKMYPKLSFTLKYAEPGMGFAGTLILKGGRVVKDEERAYNYKEDNN